MLNQTTLDLRKEKWTLLIQEFTVFKIYTGCGSQNKNRANFQDSERTNAGTKTNDTSAESPNI